MSDARRRPVLELLARYRSRNPDEHGVVDRIRVLVERRPNCLERTCFAPGHLTGAAWIVSSDHRRALLTHHRKLDRWLQLGGHCDGDPRLERVALREAREESGLRELELVGPRGELVPLDLDVHDIPARGEEPAHEHHDVRFLLIAAPGQQVVVSDESHEVRWFWIDEVARVAPEESVLRMARKARAWLADGVRSYRGG